MSGDTDVIVLGAGPAGLAVGGCLRARKVPFVVLEQADAVGATWRRHYERLHLHTVARFSALPRMGWPEGTPMYPSRARVVDYLERYARHFAIEPRFRQKVFRAHHEGGRWVAETSGGEVRARALVVATGYNRVPNVPEIPGRETFGGTVLHSSEYRNGTPFRGRRVVVVGLGNSGGEIAIDLWESGAETTISLRSPVHVVPRDLMGIPAQINALFGLGRLPPRIADPIVLRLLDRAMGDLSRWGLRRPEIGPARQVVEKGRIPLIDIGTVALVKQGKIPVVPGPEAFTEKGLLVGVEQRREIPADAVVLATGYRPVLDAFLDRAAEVTDARGYPRFHGVEIPSAPGLYFIGFRNPLIGQLRDISLEAERIAGAIARRS